MVNTKAASLTSVAAATAAAACHYQSGRFTQSLIELQRCHQLCEEERRKLLIAIPTPPAAQDDDNIENDDDNPIIMIDDGNHQGNVRQFHHWQQQQQQQRRYRQRPKQRSASNRVELVALPLLARRADVAMTQFRQALQLSSSSSHPSGNVVTKGESSLSGKKSLSSLNRPATTISASLASPNLINLWDEALASNRIYRRSLTGAAMALVQTCGSELLFAASEERAKGEARERVIRCDAIHQRRRRQKRRINDDEDKSSQESIRKAMKDTSLAMIMAGVAASHLLLYRHDGDCRSSSCNCHCRCPRRRENTRQGNNGVDHRPKEEDAQKKEVEDAWSVLVDAAAKAGDLMRIEEEWTKTVNNGNADSLNAVIEGAGTWAVKKLKEQEICRAPQSSILEESLIILNKSLCSNDEGDDENSMTELTDDDGNGDEIERGNLAMQTFRSALGVAALASGRLILPKLSISAQTSLRVEKTSTSNRSHERKRQRRVNMEERNYKYTPNRNAIEEEDGGMNFKYSHSSPSLHSRSKLVDALSFHLAAIRHAPGRKLFFTLREACLREAIEWDNQACALYDIDDGTDGMRAGYAWKMNNCLHALETLSDPHPLGDKVREDDERWKEYRERKKRVVESLELLAPSSSRFASDWLGCFHALEGEYIRALDKFQLSLNVGGRLNESSDADEEMVEGGGIAQRRTTVNMALCLLSVGEANAPLELLLHLWVTLLEFPSNSSTLNSVASPRPLALLLSSVGYEFERTYNNSSMYLDQVTKLQILWKLFQASCIAKDWSTCLNATEEIMLHGKDCDDRHDDSRCGIARTFALLQCRRTSAAQDATRILLQRLTTCGGDRNRPDSYRPASLLLSVAALYHADVILLNDQRTNNHDEDGISLHYNTQRAIDALDSSLKTMKSKDKINDEPSNQPLGELRIIAYNDHGIALLMNDDSIGALRYFREAAKLATLFLRVSADDTQPLWLLLPTYFNLSLLLMRDGHMEESAKSWLQLRGHFDTWQKALHGDDGALRIIKHLHATSISLHDVFLAKRSMQTDARLWDQETVMEWIPPIAEGRGYVTEDSTRVGGLDASQITALDAILLKYACSTAERNSASSFRRRAGRLGPG